MRGEGNAENPRLDTGRTLIGALATQVWPCQDRRDGIATLLCGVSGALLGELFGRRLGVIYGLPKIAGAVMALISALVFVVPYRLIARRQSVASLPGEIPMPPRMR